MNCVYRSIFNRISGFLFSSKWPTLQLSFVHRRFFALGPLKLSPLGRGLYVYSDPSVITFIWFCHSIRHSRIYRKNRHIQALRATTSGIAKVDNISKNLPTCCLWIPLTNYCQRLHTQTIPEVVPSKACTYSPAVSGVAQI